MCGLGEGLSVRLCGGGLGGFLRGGGAVCTSGIIESGVWIV